MSGCSILAIYDDQKRAQVGLTKETEVSFRFFIIEGFHDIYNINLLYQYNLFYPLLFNHIQHVKMLNFFILDDFHHSLRVDSLVGIRLELFNESHFLSFSISHHSPVCTAQLICFLGICVSEMKRKER